MTFKSVGFHSFITLARTIWPGVYEMLLLMGENARNNVFLSLNVMISELESTSAGTLQFSGKTAKLEWSGC